MAIDLLQIIWEHTPVYIKGMGVRWGRGDLVPLKTEEVVPVGKTRQKTEAAKPRAGGVSQGVQNQVIAAEVHGRVGVDVDDGGLFGFLKKRSTNIEIGNEEPVPEHQPLVTGNHSYEGVETRKGGKVTKQEK